MNNLSNRPQNKNFGNRAGRIAAIKRKVQNKKLYDNHPKLCNQCNSKIPYEQKLNKFCNRSCSAIFNNTGKICSLERKIKLSSIQKAKFEIYKESNEYSSLLYSKLYFKNCVSCNKSFYMKRDKTIKKYCSKECNSEYYTKKSYRLMCKFDLNKKQYPSLYNGELINKFGWYVPVNNKQGVLANLTGVCWDHLFRVQDGYILKIPPEVMKHPANAELVPWPINASRKKSLITYNELLERIKLWNSGITKLKTFFTYGGADGA